MDPNLPPILPADRYLAAMLGISDEDFARYKAEVRRRAAEGPQPSVVAGIDPGTLAIISLVLTTLSVGLTIAASFFKPRPTSRESEPPQLKVRDRADRPSSQNERFVPRYGFDSTQDITTLGSIIPIVYALRESIGGVTYGGVRVNTTLLWSQLYSLGGSQMLRGIFLIGEGPMAAVDPINFASGGNTLACYDFGYSTANQIGSRMSVYARYASGLTTRILPSNHIYGRAATEDVGNTDNLTGTDTDVFGVRIGNTVTTDFCAAHRPSNQTRFGLYAFCGNDFGMRPNPVFEPQVSAQLRPAPGAGEGKAKVKCVLDEAKWAQRRKMQSYYGSRSGITSQGLGTIGGLTTYTLYSSSDKDTLFSRDLKDLTNPSEWTVKKELITPETPGSFVKPFTIGSGASTQVRTKYRDDNTANLQTSLLNRLTVSVTAVQVGKTVNITWPGLTNIDLSGGKADNVAWIAVNLSFNTAGLDNVSNDGIINTELELLKASKFKITLKNNLTDDDPEDDIEVVQYHKVKIKTESEQTIALTTPSVSTETTEMGTFVTGVNFPQLNPTVSVVYPTFSFGVGWTYPATSGSFTNVSWFSIKNVYFEDCQDIAAAVAGRQKSWDDSLIIGELYKIGTGLAVCTSRTNGAFSSEVDGAVLNVTATFKTVRTGVVSTNADTQIVKDGDTWIDEIYAGGTPEPRNVATTDGHIMRCAIASVSTTRPCKVVEFGLKSTLGIRINGITNFNTAKSYSECDARACLDYQGDIINEGAALYTDNHRSSTVSTNVERYSFFFISYRVAGSSGAFTRLQDAYGVASATSQAVFNYIQLDMGDIKQWEFQFEPLSGYEIRNHVTGNLYLLNASFIFGTVVNVTDPTGVKVMFTGMQVTKSADTFAITVGRRPAAAGTLDYPQSDASYSNGDLSLIDTWGKLAEKFIYEEISSSAESGPEHEIVYINEIVPNTTQPLYDNLALLGVNIMSSVEWQQFNQFSCYVTGGKTCRRLLNSLSTGATHLFPDILLDLLTNMSYGAGDLVTDQMIDLTSFQTAAQWCQDRNYFFDGVVADRVNLRQWAADTAATHLLIFGESDGKFFLRPALQATAVSIKGLFTAGNIAEGSFQLQYLDPEDRDPIRVSVRYREERASTNLDNPGIFPTVREVLVAEAGVDSGAPVESLDLSDYCTSRAHAIDAAKFIIRMRRIPTHSVRFTTTHEGVLAQLAPSDYIRVAMDETEYDEFNNGVVTTSGALVSTKALSDGIYDVIAWNGEAGAAPADTTLTVSANGTVATPTGIVFTVKLPSTQVRTYQIERITPNEDGTFTLEAVHMPTTGSGILTLYENIELGTTTSTSNWSIEG